ncbi:MAG: alpha/beta fold hydrolase [Deltaproteobacteria bacterium]|nr:alpha/beta fold hydrolase [Deltaproteobacteria bacterium]
MWWFGRSRDKRGGRDERASRPRGLHLADAGPFDLEFVETSTGTIEVGCFGEGPIVVLLPGKGCAGTEQFGELATALGASGFSSIAVNPRGVSRSVAPLDELSLHHMASDVAHVLERFGQPAHVVGRALGNRVARCFAMDFPRNVKSTTLISAGGLVPPERPVRRAKRRRRRRRKPRWEAGARAHLHAAQTTPLDEWWPGGEAPTLVVQGLVDRTAPPENGRRLAASDPERVRVVEIYGAGHDLLKKHPRAVIPPVVAFIEEMEVRSTPNRMISHRFSGRPKKKTREEESTS